MTFAKEVVTASILNNRVRFHRARAERFGLQASRSRSPELTRDVFATCGEGDCHSRAA